MLPVVATRNLRTRAERREHDRAVKEADVSVEMIYKASGGKPGLVRAIWERGLADAGPIPAYRRSDAMRLHETDLRAVIRQWGTLTTEIAHALRPFCC